MRKLLMGACLCTAASGVAALSLGPSRGAVVLGSPIDLMFEVRTDPGKDLASSCLSAQLVSGASRIADSRVQVTPVLGGTAPMVRVQTRMAADEPVLTVTLAAGCEGRVSRTYTFLADPPAATPARGANLGPAAERGGAADAPAGMAGAEAVERSLAVRVPNAEGDDLLATGRDAKPPRRAAAPRAAAQPARPAPPRAQALAAAPAAPRLIVEPLDLWLDTPLTLRLTRDERLTLSLVDETKRAEAAALWKALSATPEDLQQAMARLDKLQADAAAQGRQVEAERSTVTDLRRRLEQAEQEHFSANWVYSLAGLLALAVGGIAWLLRRMRRDEQMAWRHSVARSEAHTDGAVLGEGADGQPHWQVEPDAADTWHPSSLPPEEEQAEHLPVDAPDTIPVEPLEEAVAAPALKAARVQQIAPPDALFDIQQQAEFYISIGEHEQAIEVLRAHIDDHGDAVPWAYLESLRLFHKLGRTDSFNRMRGQFQEHFNVRVPGFGQFQHSGQTLEDYPETLAQIEALWSSPEVMVVLDGFLFRRDGERDGERERERFDLAAFDDLLLLLAIAQTTPAHLRGAPPPRERTTPRIPGKAALPVDRSLDSIAGGLSLAPSGYDQLRPQSLPDPTFDLDVDLTQVRVPDIEFNDPLPTPEHGAPLPGAGFGLDDDKLELRFELEQLDRKRF